MSVGYKIELSDPLLKIIEQKSKNGEVIEIKLEGKDNKMTFFPSVVPIALKKYTSRYAKAN